MITRLSEWFRYDPSRYPLGYNPGLDGLRGTATLCVLAAHLSPTWCPGAFLYMDMFFVMSAYLITSLLLKRWAKNGNVGFGTFYARRVLRLFPANYAMIGCFVVAAYLILDDDFIWHVIEAAAAATYVSNWTRAFEAPIPGFLSHTWSLAVEEQFYLIWPVLLTLLLKAIGLRIRLVVLLAVLALGSAGWRSWLTFHGASMERLYNGTDVRADALLIGCALGIALAMPKIRNNPTLQRTAKILAAPSLIALLVGGFTMDQHNLAMYAGISLFFTLASACLITALVLPEQTIAHQAFRSPPLVFLGRICYGLYIWHFPIFMFIMFGFGITHPVVAGLIGVPLTFAAAILSWRFIESPFLKAKDRIPIQGPAHATRKLSPSPSPGIRWQRRESLLIQLPSLSPNLLRSPRVTAQASQNLAASVDGCSTESTAHRANRTRTSRKAATHTNE
ncbi:acyltransferase [Mycolicibacterium mucogenicum]|uniref:acyltransferase family protein n=1 Tax=Mycolicibacterium mucogenicum TaxID=56689 RepID=UPI00226A7151|nr:acyltransferase [Mycolicibacterium mucogenicum]MCX8560346.1 acyltransferase [Mycolicibacterium mucogenicum]